MFPKFELTYWIYQTVAMLITCYLIPRLKVNSIFAAFVTVLCLAFINSHLWSAALFFEIPNTFTHRTLVLLIANGVIFWLVVKLLPGIEIKGFMPAIVAPVVFTITSILIATYAPLVNWQEVFKQTKDGISKVKVYVEDTKENLEQNPQEPTPENTF